MAVSGELATLKTHCRMSRVADGRVRIDLGAIRVGGILRVVAEITGLRVVPEVRAVVRVAIDDHVTDAWRHDGLNAQMREVIVGEPRRKHAPVHRLRKTRADAHAYRFE